MYVILRGEKLEQKVNGHFCSKISNMNEWSKYFHLCCSYLLHLMLCSRAEGGVLGRLGNLCPPRSFSLTQSWKPWGRDQIHIFVWPPSFVSGQDLTLFLSQTSLKKTKHYLPLCTFSYRIFFDCSALQFKISCTNDGLKFSPFPPVFPSTFPSYYSHTYNEPLLFYILFFLFALLSPSPLPLTVFSHHCSSLFSFLSPSGDPLQFPGDPGGAGEADV